MQVTTPPLEAQAGDDNVVHMDIRPDPVGMARWALGMEARALEPKARNEAARLFMLASAFPTVPAGQLLELAANGPGIAVSVLRAALSTRQDPRRLRTPAAFYVLTFAEGDLVMSDHDDASDVVDYLSEGFDVVDEGSCPAMGFGALAAGESHTVRRNGASVAIVVRRWGT